MQYFVGKRGKLTIPDIKDDGQVVNSGVPTTELKIRQWEYINSKTPVDISNTNAYGKESYIGNLTAGTIDCTGYLNDELFNSLYNQDNIPAGTFAKFELFVDFPASGFTVWALIQNFTYNTDVRGAVTFAISAVVCDEPE